MEKKSKEVSKEDLYIKRYKRKLASYGIYCKEEEQRNWVRSCEGLINTGKDLNEKEWNYESCIFESSGEIMKEIGENRSWEEIEMNFYFRFDDLDLIQDISEMVLIYSPKGIEFVNEVIKKHYYLKELDRLHPKFCSERAKYNYKQSHPIQKRK